MIVSLIAAVSANMVIGRNNDIPWSLPDDSKYFMNTTKGHFIILGRKNYDSLPVKYKPLPNRTNVIITRQKNFNAPGCVVTDSLEKALNISKAGGEQEVFVIGGAEIYDLALPIAQRLYLTEIAATIEGDTFFPRYDRAAWREVSRNQHPADDRHQYAFDFVVYDRI